MNFSHKKTLRELLNEALGIAVGALFFTALALVVWLEQTGKRNGKV